MIYASSSSTLTSDILWIIFHCKLEGCPGFFSHTQVNVGITSFHNSWWVQSWAGWHKWISWNLLITSWEILLWFFMLLMDMHIHPPCFIWIRYKWVDSVLPTKVFTQMFSSSPPTISHLLNSFASDMLPSALRPYGTSSLRLSPSLIGWMASSKRFSKTKENPEAGCGVESGTSGTGRCERRIISNRTFQMFFLASPRIRNRYRATKDCGPQIPEHSLENLVVSVVRRR